MWDLLATLVEAWESQHLPADVLIQPYEVRAA
jgi:hypothetical protein